MAGKIGLKQLAQSGAADGEVVTFDTALDTWKSAPTGAASSQTGAGGRLTLTTAVPITTSDVTGAGTIFYTPHINDEIGISDGVDFAIQTFTEISLVLSIITDKNYDVFIFDNVGTLTLELSAKWTTDTTRADALSRLHGVFVKDSAKTRRYLGTIRGSGANVTEGVFASVTNAKSNVSSL